MTEALVQLNLVSRRFALRDGDALALDHVSCEIVRGDRIAIMGPSGSGKSTLLTIIAQLDDPSDGHIAWPGFDSAVKLRPRHIGLAFQTPSLIPSLTVIENVEVPLLILDPKEDKREAAIAVLRRLQLDHLADRLPEELSGGQAQRVAVARAMITEPGLLLADEPTGQLDQSTGQELIRALIEHSELTDTALVIATHDPLIARQMKSVWHMNYGRLETNQRLRAVS